MAVKTKTPRIKNVNIHNKTKPIKAYEKKDYYGIARIDNKRQRSIHPLGH